MKCFLRKRIMKIVKKGQMPRWNLSSFFFLFFLGWILILSNNQGSSIHPHGWSPRFVVHWNILVIGEDLIKSNSAIKWIVKEQTAIVCCCCHYSILLSKFTLWLYLLWFYNKQSHKLHYFLYGFLIPILVGDVGIYDP